MSKFKIAFSAILLLCLLPSAYSNTYNYFRSIQCANVTIKNCAKWTQNLYISKTSYLFYCFPANVYVATRGGPKKMAELVAGKDQVLGINPSNGHPEYSLLSSWLHRDTLAEAQYQALSLDNGTYFEASAYHNLAYFDQKGKINYKFANQFKGGDRLVGFPSEAISLSKRESGLKRKGLYSPYTQFQNYFVYEGGFKNEGNNGSMILAHVMSQLDNPSKKNTLTHLLMWGTNLFSHAYQPDAHEVYTHPSIEHFSFVYGNSWKQAHNTVTYSHEDWTVALDLLSNGKSSSSSRRQEQKRITYAITSIIAMLNNPINF